MSDPDYKNILLQLCASLTKVDHIGAAWEQVEAALNMAGIETSGGAEGIAKTLGELGVSTLDGQDISMQRHDPYDYQ